MKWEREIKIHTIMCVCEIDRERESDTMMVIEMK